MKEGNGAFMQTHERAVALARLLVGVGESAGKRTLAFITGMDQPLGRSVGNWLEVVEAVECLSGRNVPDLMEVVLVLGGAMVFLGGKASSIEEGMRHCTSALWSGKAYERFLRVVERQGGDTSVFERAATLPGARIRRELVSAGEGTVASWDTRASGEITIALGAGRTQISDHGAGQNEGTRPLPGRNKAPFHKQHVQPHFGGFFFHKRWVVSFYFATTSRSAGFAGPASLRAASRIPSSSLP